ncbi:TolC family protein [Derxia gummosa]|uniref:TolC family protein n=1 Tax=Derxia gummosa DSM 723 TaxID=1121388 RepID=A0A8B6X9T6_9BURK|nr:TolC family protein [Derxia gummosa]
MQLSRPFALRLGAVAVLAACLSACAPLQPERISLKALAQTTEEDRAAVRAEVPPLGERLTLDEAIARALKFNVDRRARQMEETFELRQFELVGYDQLPKLLASAGYTARDSDRLVRSVDSVTGTPLSYSNPALSQSRAHMVNSLTLSWSLLDYGLARYNAEQAGDRLLAATERRRKATHLLVQDVRIAYFRAASAQLLRDKVAAALRLADEALADSRKAEGENLRAPLDGLRYQRQLTENMRLLEAIQQELSTARFELAQLMNAPITAETTLAADELPAGADPLATPAEAMEDTALAQNPDLREQMYQRRIAAIEARKVVARAYPNLSFSLGTTHDSDRYLVNPTWTEVGAQFGTNLFNLLSLPAQKRGAAAAIQLADERRLAAHVAVIAQVHIAREQLAGTRRQFERAESLWQLDQRILEQTRLREEARAGSKLDRVAAETTAIVSQLRRFQALAQWHAAISRLQSTLGVDAMPDSADDLSLDALRAEVRSRLLGV